MKCLKARVTTVWRVFLSGLRLLVCYLGDREGIQLNEFDGEDACENPTQNNGGYVNF